MQPPSLTITRAPTDDVIAVVGHGFWTEADVAGHFEKLKNEIWQWRLTRGAARVLVDHRATAVQGSAVFDEMRNLIEGLYRRGDRVALVVAKSLLAMQVRRVNGVFERRQFATREEALTWLRSPADGDR